MSKALFLSVRPNFAELILSGAKTVEVRRVVPRGAQPGSLVLIYASSPEKALWGICFIDNVSTGRPETIWRKLGNRTGLRKREFLAYLGGAEKAVALHVSKPVVFSRPIPLSEIRKTWRAFQPPQSFSYVALSKVEELASVGGPKAAIAGAAI
jgi:predicted transcriptional regulator